MKKILLTSIAAVTLMAASFVAGSMHRAAAEDNQNRAAQIQLAAVNAALEYQVLSDIAINLESGNGGKALCSLKLLASSNANEIRSCLSDQGCKASAESEILKIAPEMVGGQKLRIRYYAPNELCDPAKQVIEGSIPASK